MKKVKTKKETTVLIIEDNKLLRDGLAAMLNEQPDLKVIGAYSATDKSVAHICDLMPDIVLIDLGLGRKNSLRLVKSLKGKVCNIKMIVMDLVPADDDILDFVKAGAEGFILKDAKVTEFLKTIIAVGAGEKVLPSHMTGSLFSQVVDKAINNGNSSIVEKASKMTKREREVVQLIAQGKSNKEIGKLLHLSPFTVKSHVHNLLEKMALRTRLQISNFAHTNKEFKSISI